MASFIKLHGLSDNTPVVINAACIRYIEMDEDKDTCITLTDDSSFNVHESVDRIYDMLKK